jgi:hypothetical protein
MSILAALKHINIICYDIQVAFGFTVCLPGIKELYDLKKKLAIIRKEDGVRTERRRLSILGTWTNMGRRFKKRDIYKIHSVFFRYFLQY